MTPEKQDQANTSNVGIIGSGAWGTALGILLSGQGHQVRLLVRSDAVARKLAEERVNHHYLPKATFPESLTIHSDRKDALRDVDAVIFAVPSVAMRPAVQMNTVFIPSDALLVSATKGLEIDTGKRMSELISEVVSMSIAESLESTMQRVCALSGPNLAVEIASGLPALATVASASIHTAEAVQRLMSSVRFRVYASSDIVGVELGGTLKNIIGIGAGFIDGAELGANIKAAYVTRGLHEITRLGVAMGAMPSTFAGLSGTGDMLATCYSSLSRNYRVGYKMASGLTLDEALQDVGQTAEGVPTTRATVKLAQKLGVEMPITETAHRVMFEGDSPEDAIRSLMARELQHESVL